MVKSFEYECWDCGRLVTSVWIDGQRSQEFGKVVRLCLYCTRQRYPDLFPPKPEQLSLAELIGIEPHGTA